MTFLRRVWGRYWAWEIIGGGGLGAKKDAEDFGVHFEIKPFVVTVLVMRYFSILRGAPRACEDFCNSTAVSRIKLGRGRRVAKW